MGFCSDTQSQKSRYGYQNPWGPSSIDSKGRPTFTAPGASQYQPVLLNYLGSQLPAVEQAGQQSAQAFSSAAANPGWKQASDLATRTMSGAYLNGSPQLTAAMDATRRQAMADSANQNARIRSQYGQNGMTWSTGNQQAQQGATAIGAANAANINAQTYLNNYQAERANQNNAINNLATATGQPLSYLSNVANQYLAPASQTASTIGSIAGGGSLFNTGTSGSYNPSLGSSIVNGMTLGGSLSL